MKIGKEYFQHRNQEIINYSKWMINYENELTINQLRLERMIKNNG